MITDLKLKSWVILAICLLTPHLLLAQSLLTVSGCVTDENGEPMIGASVLVRGSTTGTVTDLEGNYTIKVKSDGSLTFSYVGYDQQTVAVKNRTTLNVVMSPSVNSLEDVVVVGYGVQKKVTMTGAVSKLNGDELLKSPSASLGNAMAGSHPGDATVHYFGRIGKNVPTA